MSQASGIRTALPTLSTPAVTGGASRLWKNWQIAYVLARTIFLIGFFFLMENRRYHDTSLLITSVLGNKLLIQALILLGIGTCLEMLLFALINWWEAKRPTSCVIWRVATVVSSEALLWVFCFIPAFYVMFLGPAAIEIMNTFSRK
jgi:hypothetical protein